MSLFLYTFWGITTDMIVPWRFVVLSRILWNSFLLIMHLGYVSVSHTVSRSKSYPPNSYTVPKSTQPKEHGIEVCIRVLCRWRLSIPGCGRQLLQCSFIAPYHLARPLLLGNGLCSQSKSAAAMAWANQSMQQSRLSTGFTCCRWHWWTAQTEAPLHISAYSTEEHSSRGFLSCGAGHGRQAEIRVRRGAQATEQGSQVSLMIGRDRGGVQPPPGWRVGRAGFRSALSGEPPGTRSSAETPTAADGELPAPVAHMAGHTPQERPPVLVRDMAAAGSREALNPKP